MGRDVEEIRAVTRDLLDVAARHGTELVHAPSYGVLWVWPVTLETPCPPSQSTQSAREPLPRRKSKTARPSSDLNQGQRSSGMAATTASSDGSITPESLPLIDGIRTFELDNGEVVKIRDVSFRLPVRICEKGY